MSRRVRLKSWLRTTFATLSTVTGVAAFWRVLFARRGVRILAYHGVEPEPTSPLSVSVDNFERQVAFLTQHYDVIDFPTFAKWQRGDYASAKPKLLLTFDDGFANNLTYAAPILMKYSAPATFFIIGSKLDDADARYMKVPDVKELLASGQFSVGSHSLTHLSMARISGDQLEQELGGSGPLLERSLDIKVDCFCYPYGTFNDFDRNTRSALQRHGYTAACTSINGINLKGTDPLSLRRTKVEASDDMRTFRRLLNGAMDGWFLVDYFLRFLQSPDAVQGGGSGGAPSGVTPGGQRSQGL